MPGYIHHIQWSVADRAGVVARLRSQFGLRLLAERPGETALRAGTLTFLVSSRTPPSSGHPGQVSRNLEFG